MWLFGKKGKKKKGVNRNTKDKPLKINGNKIKDYVTKLVDQSIRDGWNPFASVKVICEQCSESISLDQTCGSGFYLIHEGREVDYPVVCPKCESNRFYIENTKTSFKDWLKNCVDNNPCWQEDPSSGLKDIETGELFTDHGFVGFNEYSQAWNTIKRFIDESGDLNERYKFEYILTRSYVKHYIQRVIAVLHYNWKKEASVLVIKDFKRKYWCAVDMYGAYIEL
jgi:hypothetical protein